MTQEIDWDAEKERFTKLAYTRCERAARRAFKRWPEWKQEDAVAEAVAKMWVNWSTHVVDGIDPVQYIPHDIHWSILHVKYDKKIAGRARMYDVMDYRAKMSRHEIDEQGQAHPTNRSDPNNSWVDWVVKSKAEDPAEMAEALETAGLTAKEWSR